MGVGVPSRPRALDIEPHLRANANCGSQRSDFRPIICAKSNVPVLHSSVSTHVKWDRKDVIAYRYLQDKIG